MTEVVLETDDNEYYEIFSSSLFNGKLKRPLNWLEESDRRQNKKSTEKEETDE
jgi:hypothetical protein